MIALTACGGGSSKKVEPTPPTPPPPEPPTYTISARGGEGRVGYGGQGGYFDVYNDAGGDVKILRSGAVDTAVTLPTTLPYLGTNWQDVTADATLEVGTTGFFLTEGSSTVANASGTVTGIRVRPGVTLTIKPNYTYGGVTRQYVYIYLDDGLIVEGTIKIAPRDLTAAGDGLSPDTADFDLSGVGGLYVASTGKIDVSGASSTTANGGAGGYFDVDADVVNNAGEITTAGGNGTNGGSAGYIYLYGYEGYAVSSGTLNAAGGAGSASGAGGDGNDVYIYSEYGYIALTGTVSTNGGDGATGGGDAGYVYTYTDPGATIVTATINAYGGDATVSGNGGNGDYIYFYSYGPVRVAASIDGHGGAGAGALGNGGNGAYLEMYPYYNWSWDYGEYEPNAATALLSGNINLDGGAGENGGNAGYLYIYSSGEDDATPLSPGIQLVAYTSIDNSGGKGATDGGDAGYSYDCENIGCYYSNWIFNWYGYDENSDYIAGAITNEADFVTKGGDGGTGAGGDSYGVAMSTDYEVYPPYTQGTKNSGAIDASGGNGGTTGGGGGYIYLYGKFSLENSGALTANSGNGGTSDAGAPGWAELYSEGPITASGAVTFNGGGSTDGAAYAGGWLYISTTNLCTVSGAITMNGGSSTNGAGGNGGYLWVNSQDGASNFTSTVSVAAGTGTGTAPVAGEVWIDGMQTAGP